MKSSFYTMYFRIFIIIVFLLGYTPHCATESLFFQGNARATLSSAKQQVERAVEAVKACIRERKCPPNLTSKAQAGITVLIVALGGSFFIARHFREKARKEDEIPLKKNLSRRKSSGQPSLTQQP